MHKSYEELEHEIEQAAELVTENAEYVHYKDTASRYRVIGFTILEATDEVGVKYVSISNSRVEFTRALSKWLEDIDGRPRYERVVE